MISMYYLQFLKEVENSLSILIILVARSENTNALTNGKLKNLLFETYNRLQLENFSCEEYKVSPKNILDFQS